MKLFVILVCLFVCSASLCAQSNHPHTREGLTPISGIDEARRLYQGKTLWIRAEALSADHGVTAKQVFVKVRRYSPVQVLDILVSTKKEAPVRFILQTEEGKHGFIDARMGSSEIDPETPLDRRFNSLFLTEDPRTTYRWSTEVWSLIKEKQVRIGMTTEQVEMSLGVPRGIVTTQLMGTVTEQWTYGTTRTGRRFLTFQNRVLTRIDT